MRRQEKDEIRNAKLEVRKKGGDSGNNGEAHRLKPVPPVAVLASGIVF